MSSFRDSVNKVNSEAINSDRLWGEMQLDAITTQHQIDKLREQIDEALDNGDIEKFNELAPLFAELTR